MSLFSFPSGLVPLIDVFEKLGIRYYIGGSVASSAHGIARSTQDIDIIADLHLQHARLLKSRLFDLQAFERTSSSGLENSLAGRQFQLASPEDTILNKLEWYRQGGEVSERQWTDVLGVLKVQSKSLDRAYLLRWAVQLGVEDLLKRSLEDAGFNAESA